MTRTLPFRTRETPAGTVVELPLVEWETMRSAVRTLQKLVATQDREIQELKKHVRTLRIEAA